MPVQVFDTKSNQFTKVSKPNFPFAAQNNQSARSGQVGGLAVALIYDFEARQVKVIGYSKERAKMTYLTEQVNPWADDSEVLE